MIPYEDLSNIDSATAILEANETLVRGWVRKNYGSLKLSEEIPWALSGHTERSWNFHLHCWEMLDRLLHAHSKSQDIRFLQPCILVALDWVSRHEETSASQDVSPFAWYDMAVGMRTYRLAYIIDAASNDNLLTTEQRTRLWSSLLNHQHCLEDDTNFVFHNNHGYYQAAGQIAAGRRFSGKSLIMEKALAQGRSRLKFMIDQQFGADGVHREHSPDYHRMVYDTLKCLISAGLVDDPETIAFALRIEEALSWFIFPNQRMVNFGDSDDRAMNRSAKESERKWSTPAMRFWTSGGKVGTAPQDDVRVFPDGGYWIARRAGHDKQNPAGYSYLALTGAFHSRTHKHADDLSIVWFDRGHNILVDAGRYGYLGKAEQGSALWLQGHWYSDPRRVYVESTRAHNTLEFDGKNYIRKGAKPYGSALKRWGQQETGIYFVEAECKHFGAIRHARLAIFLPNYWVLVVDWFHDNNDAAHSVKQWFHIGHELQVMQNDAQFAISIPGSQQALRVASLLGSVDPSRLFIGEDEPEIQGWWSAKERHFIPNYAFNFEKKDASTGVFATLFSFSDELTPDVEWSKVNVSGRRGQLRWSDGQGIHEVRFDRPDEGEVKVAYARK
ncbi:heparinase II/III domain-containing protein [Bordetella hinzii]|uniref:heparinase II/III domain-containing protein n=1 Tax=Bordetella hinzii TaxID=103855 RepID=UPI001154D5EC|nr:heparinase II/III family protein [Bordetella hinzii]QDJ32896.1 hypothetical protein CBR68_11550 [Bordetella hinzii]